MPRPDDFKDLIGIPFVFNGRDLRGLDCYGLAREALRRFGYDVPEFSFACYDALDIYAAVLDQVAGGRWQPVAPPIPAGAVVVMAIDPVSPLACQHIGVHVGSGIVLHTLNKRRSSTFSLVGSTPNDQFYRSKIRGYFLWRG